MVFINDEKKGLDVYFLLFLKIAQFSSTFTFFHKNTTHVTCFLYTMKFFSLNDLKKI